MIRRGLVLLALSHYLLAVTVGEWFHDHGHSAFSSHSACAGAHGGPQAAGCEHPADWGKHDACPICRFLAQKPIPARTIETVHSAPLADEVVAPQPIRPAVRVPSAQQIRAPPFVA